MKSSDIVNAILQALYEPFFRGEMSGNLNATREQLNLDETNFWNVVDEMDHSILIKPFAMGGNYIIRPLGILRVEKDGLAPAGMIKENQRLRTIILDTLAQVYEEQGSMASASIDAFIQKGSSDQNLVANNLQFLENVRYIKSYTFGSDTITPLGLAAVRKWREQTALEEEFERISAMSPQPRGRALQRYLATVLGKHGWSQEEGVKSSNEEMDVIVYRDREYYLVECKWEKDPIEASVVRELYGKLGNRVGVRGIVISMSGFTEGAAKQVESYVGTHIILFFGPNDVQSLVNSSVGFEEMLN